MPPGDDIDRIMAVMQAGFDPAYREAWNRRQVEDALLLGNCHYLLQGADGGPCPADVPAAGFALTRSGFEEEELLLFAVDPAHRRQGIGAAMLVRLAGAARERGARQIFLEMRRGNPAETLYRRFGFLPIGERRNYYRFANGQLADAITFAYALN